jgi:voltage-gated potassium channel
MTAMSAEEAERFMALILRPYRVAGHHPRRARNRHPARVDHPHVTLSARRAALLISVITLCIGIGGGVVMWAVDRADFPTLGSGMWFAVQTITTVGYGDHVPTSTEGRAIATLVMVTGIGFMSVITATITAIFVESARRKRGGPDQITLTHIAQRLDQIEQLMDKRLEPDQRDPDRGDRERLQGGSGP